MLWSNDPAIRDLINETAQETGTTPKEVVQVMNDFFATINNAVEDDRSAYLRLPNLGNIRKKDYPKPYTKSNKQKDES